jgi:hypothetical protein
MSSKVQFQAARIGSKLAARSAKGESLGLIGRRDLLRYYECLDRELREIKLSENEARVICEHLHGFLAFDGVSESLSPCPSKGPHLSIQQREKYVRPKPLCVAAGVFEDCLCRPLAVETV